MLYRQSKAKIARVFLLQLGKGRMPGDDDDSLTWMVLYRTALGTMEGSGIISFVSMI